MGDLNDGESVEMKGSGAKPYVLKKTVIMTRAIDVNHLKKW
jgi:hypothetical protein